MLKAGHKLRDTPRLEQYFAGMWVLKIFITSCLGGGIGRHYGLKIRWLYKPCRFESGPGYLTRNPTHRGVFWYIVVLRS